jgi:hypothetical protein
MVVGHPIKKSQNYGNLTPEKFSWQFLNLMKKKISKKVFLNSMKSFKSLSAVFLENGLGSFQTFLILKISDELEVLKRFKKQFWKQDSNNVYFDFRKISCGLFPRPLNKGIFSVFGRFIENYLRNLTCWEKSTHRFGRSASKLSKNRRFFQKTKLVHNLLGSDSRKIFFHKTSVTGTKTSVTETSIVHIFLLLIQSIFFSTFSLYLIFVHRKCSLYFNLE